MLRLTCCRGRRRDGTAFLRRRPTVTERSKSRRCAYEGFSQVATFRSRSRLRHYGAALVAVPSGETLNPNRSHETYRKAAHNNRADYPTVSHAHAILSLEHGGYIADLEGRNVTS